MPGHGADPSDRSLHERLVRGDDTALGELYDRFAATVFAIAARVTRDRTAAEDLVQDVFVFAWERPYAFDPGRGSLRAWLSTLAHRRAVDWVRREVRRSGAPAAAPPVEQPSAEETVVAADVAVRVRRALAALPEPQRRAVELAYFSDRSYRQVADDLGVPEGTVKSRMRLALRKIAAAMAGEEDR
jgi:RNA polymerase sigma-70 factor (ECF subfamily)